MTGGEAGDQVVSRWHPGEKITEGLDGLRGRLAEYRQMGARFAKWRAVIAVGDGIPQLGLHRCRRARAGPLRRAVPGEAGLVPVVEPEVLMDGAHTLQRCGEVTEELLRAVFTQLQAQRVTLEGVILKPAMVLPGSACPVQDGVNEVARRGDVPAAGCARGRSRDRVPVRRAAR